jgi:hypothetical protein
MISILSEVLWNVRWMYILIKEVIPVHACKICGIFNVLKSGFDGSNFWILLKEKIKKFFYLFVDKGTLREMDKLSFDFFHDDVRIIILLSKWKFTEDKFVEKDTQRPNIGLKRIAASLKSLGCHIMRRSN